MNILVGGITNLTISDINGSVLSHLFALEDSDYHLRKTTAENGSIGVCRVRHTIIGITY